MQLVVGHFEFVPSKANIADLPSRNMYTALEQELAGLSVAGEAPDRLVVPSVASWRAPLHEWASPPSSHSRSGFPV